MGPSIGIGICLQPASLVDVEADIRAGEDLPPGSADVAFGNMEGCTGSNGGGKKFCGGNADPVRCFQLCDMGGEGTRVDDQHNDRPKGGDRARAAEKPGA